MVKNNKKLKIFKRFQKKLTYYRKTTNSLSSNKFISLINGYRVYRNYMKFSRMKSIYFLIILSVNSIKKNFFNNKFHKWLQI